MRHLNNEKRGRLSGKLVYLSGPMTGRPDHNREAFAHAERALYKAGARHVFNPADAWRGHYGERPVWSREEYLRRDIHALTYGYDVVVQLPGWEDSAGALLETAVAQACGIEVLELGEVA